MRIKSVTISGLRSFGQNPVTLELGPRTVLKVVMTLMRQETEFVSSTDSRMLN